MSETEGTTLPYDIPTCDNWNALASFYHPLMAGSIDGTDVVAHDRAVVRAMRSSYKPNKKLVGNPAKTVMVRHLPRHIKQKDVHDLLKQFGDIERCRLVRDIITGISRGYAFVEYKQERDARHAVRESNDLFVDDIKITVDFECERNLPGWIPRRFGGGFGGKKESGQLRFGGVERPFRRPIPLNSNPLGKKTKQNGGGVKRDFRSMNDNQSYRTRNKSFKRNHML